MVKFVGTWQVYLQDTVKNTEVYMTLAIWVSQAWVSEGKDHITCDVHNQVILRQHSANPQPVLIKVGLLKQIPSILHSTLKQTSTQPAFKDYI